MLSSAIAYLWRLQPLPCFAVLWLIYLEAYDLRRRLEAASESTEALSPAGRLGLESGAYCRFCTAGIAGLYSLDGSRIALAVFSLSAVISAIQRAVVLAHNFHSGFIAASGLGKPEVAAAVGLGWVTLWRGAPLYLVLDGFRRTS